MGVCGTTLCGMAQRFNAPPGWNVPPDFVPTSDWQPDPSWPPAPDGWNYWVEDTASSTAGFGSSSSPAYGTPAPADQPAGYGTPTSPAYGAADQSTYGTPPPGAYGSTAPGSAGAAFGEAQVAAAQKAIRSGIIMLVAGVGLTIFTVVALDRIWFFTPILALVGIIGLIKGNIDLGKAKRAAGYDQGGVPPGFTQSGTTPPGQNPPGF